MDFTPTPKQAEAIQTIDRDVALTAGAGSGKTKVLVERYVHLLEKGFGLHQILAITFTRKAAQEMKDRVRQARPDLDLTDAPISTVHSFCQHVLAANPQHANIDPRFRMAEEWESRTILREVAAEVVDAAIDAGGPDILELSEDFRRTRDMVDALVKVYEEMRSVGSSDFAVADETQTLQANLAELLVLLRSSLRDWLDSLRPDDITKAKAAQIAALQGLPTPPSADDSAAYLEQVAENLKGRWSNRLADEVYRLRELADAAKQTLLDCQGQRRLRAVSRLLTDTHANYCAEKKQRSLMDFDDLETALEELLDRPEVLESLPFCHIMVDEFQDTNRRQQRIIDKLIHGHAKLFVVGDPKQSIYRFRGADVRIFSETSDAIRQRGGAVIALEENFRSAPDIIEVVNRLFSALMQDEAVEYYPLKAASSVVGAGVELLAVSADDKVSIEESRTQEGQQIARHIRWLVEHEDVSYGDITILFRAMSQVKLYERPLQELGIPFVNVSGRGFYGRQEVQDVLEVIRWVDDPTDMAARAAVLHSPFFNVSEEALFWDLCGQPESMHRTEKLKLQQAEEWYQALREIAFHRPAPIFFERLLETTDYTEAIVTSPLGKQRYANLTKLQEVSWDLWSRGHLSLWDQIQYIEQIMAETDKEGEAKLNVDEADAVTLMTVHGSKGLEFDTVFLPDLQRTLVQNQHPPIAFHQDAGLICRNTSVYAQAAALQRSEELAEAKRLLYVAVTRAERRVVLCGGPDDADAETYWCWIRSELGDSLAAQVRSVDSSPRMKSIQAEPVFHVPIKPEPLPVPVVFKRTAFSTTSVAVYQQCPRRYYLRYILHAPEEALGPRIGSSHAQGGLDPLLRGNIVHRVCERLGSFDDVDGLLVWAASMEGVLLRTEQKRELRELVRQFYDSQYFEAVLTSDVQREWEFSLPLGEDWITGIMDFVHYGDSGLWLMDLKTNAVDENHAFEEARRYDWQMQIYAWALGVLTGKSVQRAELFFLVPGVVIPVELEPLESAEAALLESFRSIKEHSLQGVGGFPQGHDCAFCGYSCRER